MTDNLFSLFKMPGSNCFIFGCNVSRNKVGIAIFKVAAGKDEYSVNWRSKHCGHYNKKSGRRCTT